VVEGGETGSIGTAVSSRSRAGSTRLHALALIVSARASLARTALEPSITELKGIHAETLSLFTVAVSVYACRYSNSPTTGEMESSSASFSPRSLPPPPPPPQSNGFSARQG
jgi:hypothetical protein